MKPQAAPGIVPGAVMPAALSKMISQNLQALLKMISIQWLLIFKKVPHYFSLSITALASLKPQAAPGIVPGAAMPAALSKMISQNLQALSKLISIQWLLIFKKVSHYLSLSISALASLKPQAAPGIVPGAAMPAALSKMILQNLRTLSKMISIQWFLIVKKVSHYFSLSIIALASLKPQAAPGIVPGAAMPAALSKMISQNLQA